MGKTTAARAAIMAELKKLCSRVYYDYADNGAAYPYLVYSLEEVSHLDGLTPCQLEVNAIDYGASTGICETLADNVQAALDKYMFINGAVQFEVYRGRRQPVREEDKKIIRRRMTFEVRMHERG